MSADTIVPNYANPQSLNRYSYVNNSPLNYIDPSGHVACRTKEECNEMGTTPGGGFLKPKPKPHDDGGGNDGGLPEPIWSTADYLTNGSVGTFLSVLSTRLQYGAGFFSYLGATSEVGLTAVGTFFGGAALSWLDGFVPIADVTGGLAGLLVGWEAGHAIHVAITNPIETALSTASAQATYLSDIFLGNTRLDVYEDNTALVVGQPTTTNATLALVGGLSTVGIGDAIIDDIGMRYSNGELGRGVYDLFGVAGNRIPFYSSDGSSWFSLQLGDK